MAWDVSEDGAKISPRYLYKGHTAAVEAVATGPAGDKVVGA